MRLNEIEIHHPHCKCIGHNTCWVLTAEHRIQGRRTPISEAPDCIADELEVENPGIYLKVMISEESVD